MRAPLVLLALLAGLASAACADQTIERPRPSPSTPLESSDGEGAGPSADQTTSAETPSSPSSNDPKKDETAPAPRCTNHRGDAITPAFGRLDGTVRAVILPGDTSCPGADDDHVMVQIDAAGETYEVAINVESTRAGVSSPLVETMEKDADLEGPTWSSGWHTGVSLDYPYGLGVHASSFVAKTKSDLGAAIAKRLVLGAKVSVFGEGYTTSDGVHEIHRNKSGIDGALVVDPTGSPTYLLFAFANQSF